jgi:valyl-tRNA synthetase
MNLQYTPSTIEKKWYKYWQDNNLFSAKPNSNKKPYTVVIPPPNVTGILHMGHMLNNTIQDVLVRKSRMQGKETCWVPGMDHASIATEARVVAMLKEHGIEKANLCREEFLEYAWQWKEKYGGVILEQLKKLGASCDWSRTRFTMDPSMYRAVQSIFIKLYEMGLVYRGSRMISWDPCSRTALSDDEVIHKPTQTDLVYIRYQIAIQNSEGIKACDEFLTIATTRPETIFGDVAICINPDDIRYANLRDKHVLVPLVNRIIPIIFDSYVDIEFGTGCLKITPAHDIKDYELGIKYNLPSINILNEDASLNDNALHYNGQDRFIARKNLVKELQGLGLIAKIEAITNSVGYSERTDAVVEPRVSTQWFLKMKDLATPALEHVLDETIKFHPNKFQNMYKSWLENIKDWCISRQLWWGHSIPAYYLSDGSCVVAASIEEALDKAKLLTNNSNLQVTDLIQDQDVLDTWFSAWIWPIEVFNGISDPGNNDFNYFYPTNDLVTAPEIIFFWVARMIMAGYLFTKKPPFSNVYFTGIVRDKQGKKMSKSLGNSPNPIDLIEKYGADGVRVGMLLCAPAGNDLLFDEKLCEQGRNFANKLWNASLLIKKWQFDKSCTISHTAAIDWFNARLQFVINEVNEHFTEFRISQSLMSLYKLVWDDFCSMYLEMIKPCDNRLDLKTYNSTILFFETILKLLHPFMPFITEEIWQSIMRPLEKESIMLAYWPESMLIDNQILKNGALAFELISAIRNAKIANHVSIKQEIVVNYTYTASDDCPIWLENFEFYIKKLANVTAIMPLKATIITNNVCVDLQGHTFYLIIDKKIDLEHEQNQILQEIMYLDGFLKAITIKLNNKRFIEQASKEIIEKERKKYSDTLEKIKILKNRLQALK